MNKAKVLNNIDSVKCTLLDEEDGTRKITPQIAREGINKLNEIWDYLLDNLK